ncbi:hypothetical protein DPEC_G00270420 [Dallia pectoralis]|uniref:Uncharacterized protein n=1 Tax=Dallia pectoralis TaxID=75939 RepID=A0ACC2FPN1_DALPE|nr:hypothetical protein DPEC_G00270420 [Dallia pectoralis]
MAKAPEMPQIKPLFRLIGGDLLTAPRDPATLTPAPVSALRICVPSRISGQLCPRLSGAERKCNLGGSSLGGVISGRTRGLVAKEPGLSSGTPLPASPLLSPEPPSPLIPGPLLTAFIRNVQLFGNTLPFHLPPFYHSVLSSFLPHSSFPLPSTFIRPTVESRGAPWDPLYQGRLQMHL